MQYSFKKKRMIEPCYKKTKQTEHNVQTKLFCTKSCKLAKLLLFVFLFYIMSLLFL